LIRMNGARISIENGEKLIAITSMRDCGTQGENGFLDGNQKNL